MDFSFTAKEDGTSKLIIHSGLDHEPEIGEQICIGGSYYFYWNGKAWVSAWELLEKNSVRKVED